MRLLAVIAVFGLLPLAACQDPPKTAAMVSAKAAAPPKYTQTGSRLSTDHPELRPDLGVMSQGALQDAIGDHTGPGYNQNTPNPQ